MLCILGLSIVIVHWYIKIVTAYPEIVPLGALIARNGMNSPGGAALSFFS